MAESTSPSSMDCAFLFLTSGCNLRCEHCYVNASPQGGANMSRETFGSALRVLAKIGIRDVRLTGGEPTIHPLFDEYLAALHEGGFACGLVSNGVTLLKREASIAKLKLLSRCWISLYGPSDVRHARTSGRPAWTFDETIEAVARAAQDGAHIGLSVSIAPGDAPSIEPMMRRVILAGIKRLRFLPLQPDGRAATLHHNWRAWAGEIETIARTVGCSPIAKHFELLTVNDAFAMSGQCGTASCLLHNRRMFSIVPDGSVYPCCFTVYAPEVRLGSISDIGIEAILSSKHGRIAESCRGISTSFWHAGNDLRISCPISSIDPRAPIVAA